MNRFLPLTGAILPLLFVGCGYLGVIDPDESTGGGGTSSLGGQNAGGASGSKPDGQGGSCGENCQFPILVQENFNRHLPPRQKVSPGSSLSLSEEVTRDGSPVLKSEQNQPGAEAEVLASFDAVKSGWLYFRAWIYIPEDTLSGELKLLGLNGDGKRTVSIGVNHEMRAFSWLNASAELSSSVPNSFKKDRWFCLQSAVFLHNSEGQVQVSIDGKKLIEQRSRDTLAAGGITHIAYGIAASSYTQIGGITYWDDVVLSQQPVDCN